MVVGLFGIEGVWVVLQILVDYRVDLGICFLGPIGYRELSSSIIISPVAQGMC